jgi:hypothetical protein
MLRRDLLLLFGQAQEVLGSVAMSPLWPARARRLEATSACLQAMELAASAEHSPFSLVLELEVDR